MTNTSLQQLKLAFYGDDFTGSTDALESLALAGMRCRLYLDVPTVDEVGADGGLDAIGVAGRSRSLVTEELADELQPRFAALKRLGARHVHYKVCSTFDSSPTVGSIGRVIDIAMPVLGAEFVPLLVAAPALGRWCVFGNLFARHGIGSDGEIYRLDRHPAMQNHPTTPADESDLRIHLARQTRKQIGLVDVLAVTQSGDHVKQKVQQLVAQSNEIILFDALDNNHLKTIGAVLDALAVKAGSLFSVGSSGVETALCEHWGQRGCNHAAFTPQLPETQGPTLVISGSCSPVTTGQIDFALAAGFAEVRLDAVGIFDEAERDAQVASTAQAAARLLASGRNVVVHSYRSAGDLRRPCGEVGAIDSNGRQRSAAATIGTALGDIARRCLVATEVAVLCVAGGDTSSYAARALDIRSLEMLSPFVRGAPICRIDSDDPLLVGLPIVFKGGQVGATDFFVRLAGRNESQ